MTAFVSQALLPIVLAFVMLGMGLALGPRDFARVAAAPREALLGLGLQLLMLPLLALALTVALPLAPMAAAGLVLVSLCPGGATSNLFSYLARGDLALSVTLTAVVSLLAPFSLPLLFLAWVQLAGVDLPSFQMSLGPAIGQLAVVTFVPVALGMGFRRWQPERADAAQPWVKRLSTAAMVGTVLALMVVHREAMWAHVGVNAVAVLLLSTGSLALGHGVGAAVGLADAQRRTIAIEVGVQNAGTAMMVALSILDVPALSEVPLLYGLLMNLPAFAYVGWAVAGAPRR
jgi:BASS family bile acid:Na+ symporter